MSSPSLLSDLQSIVGEEHARVPDTRKFVIDEICPAAIVWPGTYEEVGEVLRFANERSLSVVPQSHGGITWTGNLPGSYDIALSVSRLNSVVAYEPADLTLTCQAGARVKDLAGALGANRQKIPFASVDHPSCIARFLAHPMREGNIAWGSARDVTIGLRVVTADGRLIRTGGNVVKNVAGYDLTKLFIGSMGTLGVIVEATFKLGPVPEAQETLDLEFHSVEDGCAFASGLRERSLPLSRVVMRNSIEISDDGPIQRDVLRFRFEMAGTRAAVAKAGAEVLGQAQSNGGVPERQGNPRADGTMPEWTRGHPLTCEVSVLPSAVPALIDAVEHETPGAFVEGYPLLGLIGLTWLGAGPDERLVGRVRSIASRLGGTATVSGCHPDLKQRIDVFGDIPPQTLELMRRIKQQFDPNGILSPGRFVGRL
jgi:glycolate oxidase FAD binding subunit